MLKIKISSTDFQNVVNCVGRDKINQINKIQTRDPYEHYKDYYKVPRECLEEICRNELMAMVVDIKYLQQYHSKLFNNLKKENHFKDIREGLNRFCKKHPSGFFFTPPQSKWDYKNLQINVRPDFGFILDDRKHFVKAYFGSESLSKSAAELVCTLLSNGFPEITDLDQTYFAVLDVRRNRLHVHKVANDAMKMLLNAEAELLISLWEMPNVKAA